MTTANHKHLAYCGALKSDNHSPLFVPVKYMEAVRDVLGDIELQPCYGFLPFSINDWDCKTLFLVLPNGVNNRRAAVNTFFEERKKYNFSAIVLTNNATETKWCQKFLKNSDIVCGVTGRIQFEDDSGNALKNNTCGQLFFYFGNNEDKFISVFSKFGWFSK
jgi:hypothetical protein